MDFSPKAELRPVSTIRVGGSTKHTLQTADGISIEVSRIEVPEKSKIIICPATSVGCGVGCKFCASGITDEFKRSLTAEEILDLCLIATKPEGEILDSDTTRVFSLMGEGEIMFNRRTFDEAVRGFLLIGRKSWPFPVKITASTSGINPKFVEELAELNFDVPFKLQGSLHGPDEETRRRVMPRTKGRLAAFMTAMSKFQASCAEPGRKMDLNYIAFDRVNDQPEHAHRLIELLSGNLRQARLKIGSLNEIGNSSLSQSPPATIARFVKILQEAGLRAETYATVGKEVDGACGQLKHHQE